MVWNQTPFEKSLGVFRAKRWSGWAEVGVKRKFHPAEAVVYFDAVESW